MVINNSEEFEQAYPYGKEYIKHYPKEYPCILSIYEEDAGLMGTYREAYVYYIPKNVSINEAFLLGMYATGERI